MIQKRKWFELAYRIPDAPDRKADALLHRQASLGDGGIVVRIVALDVQLGHGHFLDSRVGQGLDRAGQVAAAAGADVSLAADAVDRDARGEPLLHVRDHAVGQFRSGGRIQVVVVDVQDRVGVRCPGGLERDADKVFTQHL